LNKLMVPQLEIQLSKDEPCYFLMEELRQARDSRGFRRYQVLTVVRDDELVKARIDMGPAGDIMAKPLQILGGVKNPVTGKIEIFYTVAQMQEMAEQERNSPREQEPEPSDLIGKAFDEIEQRDWVKKGKKVFGPIIGAR
jgi:hypothetical protein